MAKPRKHQEINEAGKKHLRTRPKDLWGKQMRDQTPSASFRPFRPDFMVI